jgi:Na+/proline symporter
VDSRSASKKVAWLFTALYLVSPLIWMIPPMVYRIIDPHLTGLETEGAYMLFCLKILPPGLIGLVLAGMIAATSSKANTTINLTATAFARDLFKGWIRPAASELSVIRVARLFTLLFGGLTILVALQIPRVGGIVEMVLSTASIAGGALFAPIIWSLYSPRQTATSVVTISLISLLVNITWKLAGVTLPAFRLERTPETLFGIGLPIVLLTLTEVWYRWRGTGALSPVPATHAEEASAGVAPAAGIDAPTGLRDSDAQNVFGIRVLGVAMLIVGAGITVLGLLATQFSAIVITVGALICIVGLSIILMVKR